MGVYTCAEVLLGGCSRRTAFAGGEGEAAFRDRARSAVSIGATFPTSSGSSFVLNDDNISVATSKEAPTLARAPHLTCRYRNDMSSRARR